MLKPIGQNAFVVRDLDEGIAQWVNTMKVGPFGKFTAIQFQSSECHGKPAELRFDAAIAYVGDFQIELICPRGPSPFQEWLDAGNSGLHHVSHIVEDMAAAEAELVARGATLLMGGTLIDGSEIGYYAIPGAPVPVVELARLNPPFFAVFDALREAAADWDGVTHTLEF